jgi:hypothetical protein
VRRVKYTGSIKRNAPVVVCVLTFAQLGSVL